MGLSQSQTSWTERGRDVSIELGGYEGVGFSLDHPGWGALTFRRPTWAAGDPIRGFSDGVPVFGVPELPGTLAAVHYDHFPVERRGAHLSRHDSGQLWRAVSPTTTWTSPAAMGIATSSRGSLPMNG